MNARLNLISPFLVLGLLSFGKCFAGERTDSFDEKDQSFIERVFSPKRKGFLQTRRTGHIRENLRVPLGNFVRREKVLHRNIPPFFGGFAAVMRFVLPGCESWTNSGMVRPMLPLEKLEFDSRYSEKVQESNGADGRDAELARMTKRKWADLFKKRTQLCRIETADEKSVGTGLLLPTGEILTILHLFHSTDEIPLVVIRENGATFTLAKDLELPSGSHDGPVLVSRNLKTLKRVRTKQDSGKEARPIAVVGYPHMEVTAFDESCFIHAFGGSLRGARVSPGYLFPTNGNSKDHKTDHDANTLRGNSGSPIFSLETGKLIGVHAGGYLARSSNYSYLLIEGQSW